MAQILDPVPADQPKEPILCRYVNGTNKIQVARICNIPSWYFERVVFPGQHLEFEALQGAQLEIHTGMMASAILSDCIPCEQLWVKATVDLPQRSLVEPPSEPEHRDTKTLESASFSSNQAA